MKKFRNPQYRKKPPEKTRGGLHLLIFEECEYNLLKINDSNQQKRQSHP
jgi:hypothetical protein